MRHISNKVLRAPARAARLLRFGPRTLAGDAAMQAGMERLKLAGVDLQRVVDGGAFRGCWTQMLRRTFPAARSLMVEPQPRWQSELRELVSAAPSPTHLVQAALGATSRAEVEFFVLDDDDGGTGSSILPENSSVPGHVERVPMLTLADAIDQVSLGVPDLIKLDVQGYEIEALRGLGQQIEQVPFLLLEVATWAYNRGAPLLDEVVAWVKSRGFVTHDLWGETRLPDGTLAQVDLLFARHDTSVRSARTIEFH